MKISKMKMLVWICLVLGWQQAAAQQPFTLKGQFKTPYTGEIFLRYEGRNYPGKAENGVFTFTGSILQPVRASIVPGLGLPTARTEFFLDPGVQAVLVDTAGTIIDGRQYISVGARLTEGGATEALAARTADEVQQKMQGIADTHILNRLMKEELQRRFREAPRSIVLLYMISNHAPLFSADELHAVYEMAGDTLRQSFFAKRIKGRVDQYGAALAGSIIKDFSQPDVNGKPVTIASLRGKYVLIDFWASWCAPCRSENPALIKTYARFKNKGFEVLAVSLDSQKGDWLKAISDDRLTWLQVSDLKGWQNEAARLFKIKSIPDNILIDKDGRVIAKDLHGDALAQQLRMLL